MDEPGVGFAKIGYPTPSIRKIIIKKNDWEHEFDIDTLRDTWYKTSYLSMRTTIRLCQETFRATTKQRWIRKF